MSRHRGPLRALSRPRAEAPRWIVLAAACLSALAASAVFAPAARAQAEQEPGRLIVQPRRSDQEAPSSPRQRERSLNAALNDARNLLRTGQITEGLEKLRDLYRAHPDDLRVLQILGAALEATDRRDEAIALYREAADRSQDPAPVLIPLERLYRAQEDWKAALAVCLEYLDRVGEAAAPWVLDEVESLVRTDKVDVASLGPLEQAVRDRPKNTMLKEVWITALLFSGKTDQALSEAAALDEEQKARGETLFRFSQLAEDKHGYEAALRGYDRLLSGKVKDAMREQVQLRKAQTLRRLGRFEEARAAYSAVAALGGNLALRARLDEAELLAREMRRTEDAARVYEDLLRELGSLPGGQAAATVDGIRLSLAECRIALGRPDEAARLYQELAESAVDPEVRAQAQFQVGEMLYFQGRLKEAEEAYYKLADESPRDEWVNDALGRVLLLGENADAGGVPVTALAQSEYQRKLGRLEQGLRLIDEALEQYPQSRAADDLLLQRTRLLLALGRFDAARAAADTLGARFAESRLAPLALFEVGEQLARLARPEAATDAQAIFLEILLRYPETLEAGQARAALQKLKEPQSDSSDGGGRPVSPPAERRG